MADELSVACAVAGAAGGLVGSGMAAHTKKIRGMTALWTVAVGTAAGISAAGLANRFWHVSPHESLGVGLFTGLIIFSLVAAAMKIGGAIEKNPGKAVGDVIAGKIPTTPEEGNS